MPTHVSTDGGKTGGVVPGNNNNESKKAYGQKSKLKTIQDEQATLISSTIAAPPGVSRFSRKRNGDGSGSSSSGNGGNNDAGADSFSESDFCQRLLVGGFVQSYVDFYHLTHRSDPLAIEGQRDLKIQVTIEDMKFIRDNLVMAEASRRQGNTTMVYVSYNKLADFYTNKRDYRTSIFFHEKCLDISMLTSDLRQEMAANHALGSVYQRMFNFEMARKNHEKHEELANSVDVLEEVAKANVELFRVYTMLAVKMDAEGDSMGALEMYNRCVGASKKCWDKAAEGEVNGKIGNLLLSRGEAAESIPYLRQQSQIAADSGNAESRCRACSALALAFDALGQADKALVELTLVSSISEQAGDVMLQSQACRALGTLYSKVGKMQEAVDALQRHFTLLKGIIAKKNSAAAAAGNLGPAAAAAAAAAASASLSMGEAPPLTARDLDLARVYVGIARGNMLMGSYLVAIQFDFASVMDWKLNRSSLPSGADTLAGIAMSRASASVPDVVMEVSPESALDQSQVESDASGGKTDGAGEEALPEPLSDAGGVDAETVTPSSAGKEAVAEAAAEGSADNKGVGDIKGDIPQDSKFDSK